MASILKVDTIQDQAGNNIINENANVITIGASGDTVDVAGLLTSDGLTMNTGANSTYTLEFGADRTSDSQALGIIRGSWNGTVVSQINLSAGDDTINKDNGQIFFRTAEAGSTANRLQIAENGDISFYEDTGTTAKLFWDASTERLGIGTSSPSYPLEIASSSQDILYLNSSHATNCKIKLQGGYHSNLFSQITESAGAFVMDVDPNGQEAGSNFRVKIGGSEKARLTTTGLGIGTSSPSQALDVVGSIVNSAHFLQSTNNSLKIISGGNATNAGANLTLYGGTEASSPGQFRFRNGTTVLMQINNAGKIFTRQTAQFDDCVTIGGSPFTGDFQIEVSGLNAVNGGSWKQIGMRLSYAGIQDDAAGAQTKDVLITIRGLSSYNSVTGIDTGGGTVGITLNSSTTTASTFTITTPSSTCVGAYVATLFANDNSTMECNG